MPVPMIVFHGDADHTVAPSNGAALVKQAMAAVKEALPESRNEETAAAGRRYTRSVHTNPHGEPLVEYWQIHGAGHAWSGGSSEGSYTDPKGPDASAEMVRFFLQNRRQDGASTPEC
jgi:poly(3-hydroxybutyrate) depolymerase